MLKLLIFAGIGGFVGTCLRFLAGRLEHLLAPASNFPWATFSVNIVGSLLIGVLYGLAERNNIITPQLNALLITGFCGGLTTFSSFSHDAYQQIVFGNLYLAALYIALSVGLGVLAVHFGRNFVIG